MGMSGSHQRDNQPSAGSVHVFSSDTPTLDGASSFDLAGTLIQRLKPGQRNLNPRDMRALGYLATLIDFHINHNTNKFSISKALRPTEVLSQHPSTGQSWFDGKRIVEFGAGGLNPLAGLVAPLLLGASECIACDLDPLQDEPIAAFAVARAIEILTSNPRLIPLYIEPPERSTFKWPSSIDISKLRAGELSSLEGSGLSYLQSSVETCALGSGHADATISFTLLEHVPDIASAIQEMARITKPGGIGSHVYDGLDHRSYTNPNVHPLEFLTVDTDAAIVYGCNRVRPTQLPALFEANGFEVVRFEPSHMLKISPEEQRQAAEPYRSMDLESLQVGRATIHVVRRGDKP